MNEISREECVSRLDTMRNSMSVCLATDNGFENNFEIMKSMCNKVISDMQKLEKVEQIISDMYFRLKDFCDDEEWYKYESAISMKQIEQIIKE